MSGGWVGLIGALILGLVINECGEVSPWLADKIVTWAARIRWPDSVEEKRRHIIERPGKLFKLFTACGFGVAALSHLLGRRLQRPPLWLTAPVRRWLASAFLAGGLAALMGFVATTIAGGAPPVEYAWTCGMFALVGAAVEPCANWMPTGLASGGTFHFLGLLILFGGFGLLDVIVACACGAVAAGVSTAIVVRLGRSRKLLLLVPLVPLGSVALLVATESWAGHIVVNMTGVFSMIGAAIGCGLTARLAMSNNANSVRQASLK